MFKRIARFLKGLFGGGVADTERVGMGLRWTPLIAVLAIIVFALAQGSFGSVVGVGFILAAAALNVGVLLGFVFAIPRGAAAADSQSLSTNTNLEKVSDWLTTIIVGITLIQLGEIGGAVEELAGAVGPSFGGGAAAEPFAIGLLLFSVVDGFMIGYLGTRLVLVLRLKRVEDELRISREPAPPPPTPLPAPPGG